ncbi:MAG: COX15/CtaA family protein [Chloroflexi bacterium]|nr:COX15/CtaA family protein [Chloroflexota bacterium]
MSWGKASFPGVNPALFNHRPGFCLPGLLGWYMVSSGLVDRPSVSHYRLTAHLLTALGLLGLCWWALLCTLFGSDEIPADRSARKPAQWLAAGLVAALLVQISYGGLMAGLKAGYASAPGRSCLANGCRPDCCRTWPRSGRICWRRRRRCITSIAGLPLPCCSWP